MYRRFFSSLRVRLMLIVLISVIPMLGLILHLCGRERACGVAEAKSDALQQTRSIARFQDRMLESAQHCLKDLERTSEIMHRDDLASSVVLTRFSGHTEGYASFAAAGPTGVVFASWPASREKCSLANTFWYRRLAAFRRPLVSGYHFCPLGNRPVIIVARPVLNAAGALKAVLMAGLDLSYLNRFLAQKSYPPGTTVTVTDRHGTLLAHYPYSKALIGTPMRSALSLGFLRSKPEGVLELRGVDGVPRIYGFATVGQPPDEEYVMVGIPRRFAYADAERDLIGSLGLLAVVMLLTVVGAWLVGDVFVLRRVRRVLSAMGQVAEGDLSARTRVGNPHGELNQLACTFDQMADQLQLREMEARQLAEEKLRRSEARMQLIIDRMPIACIVWDVECRVTLWNSSAEAIFGYSEAEALGRHPAELGLWTEVPVHWHSRWERLLNGSSLPSLVHENRTRDGHHIICEWSSTPLRGPDGAVVAVISMTQDVTERKRAETMLRKLTQTLTMLSDCNQLLVRAESELDLIEKICRLIVEEGGYRMVWVGYAENDPQKSVQIVSRWGHDEGYTDLLRLSWGNDAAGWGPAGTAIRTGAPVIVADIRSDPHFANKAEALKRGYRACIGLPLLNRASAFGALLIYSGENHVVDEEEQRLLVELAEDLAYGIGALRTREEHRRASEALRESETQFRKLYEEAPVPYHSLDEQGNICAVNRKWLEMLGYSREEVIGRWLGDFLTPISADAFRRRFERDRASGELHGMMSQVVRKDGQVLTVEVAITTAFNEQGRLRQYHGVMRDVTDIQEAENAIQTLMEGSVAITGSAYFDGIVRRLCEWLGVECAIVGELANGAHFRALSMQIDGLLKRSEEREMFRTPCGMLCKEGNCVHMEGAQEIFLEVNELAGFRAEGMVGTVLRDSKGCPIGVLVAMSRHKLSLPRRANDVMSILAAKTAAELERLRMEAERDKMERQLRQAQKMQAIGTLAGGIAHDFNNILGIIYGYSEMSLLDVPPDSLAHANIGNVIKAADRARDLVQQILAFSRKSEQELKPLRLGPIVKEVAKLLRAALPSTIRIEEKVAAGEDIILGDPTQVHQVLMNLCTNAGQAMGVKGGLLEVTLTPMYLSIEDQHRPLGLDAGPYLRLMVRDTGVGMSEAVRERIFEPYFTTKQHGEGTGLGLAVVHGIVKAYGGAISVDSQPGSGAIFTVYFPRLEAVASPEKQQIAPLARGEGTILLVDDEAELLDSARQRLEYLGYQVVVCSNGGDALEVFRQRPDDFRVVITDQTMPQLTGMELAREVLALRPQMPIILCTGYSEAATPQQVQNLGIREMLMKPLNLHELAEAVQRLTVGERIPRRS